MPRQDGQRLREAGLAFFGRVVAGQTHELTNVLNVINELAGLQADILAAAARGQAPDIEKLKQVVDKTGDQLQRGESILRAVNRFAHGVDLPVSLFDLREALEHITGLAQRSAYLKKTVLDQDMPTTSMVLETSLFGFEEAVFTCIELALTASSQQRRVTVSYRPLDEGAEITIASADPMSSSSNASEGCALLGLLVGELGGRVVSEPRTGDPHRFVLFFPSPAPRRKLEAGTIEGRNAEETHGN